MARIGTAIAAERSGVSDQTIRNWIRSGLIRGYRVGPRRLFVEEDELAGLVTEVVA